MYMQATFLYRGKVTCHNFIVFVVCIYILQMNVTGGKYDPVPYIIHESLVKGVYVLKKVNGELLKSKANISRLKVYIRREDEVFY